MRGGVSGGRGHVKSRQPRVGLQLYNSWTCGMLCLAALAQQRCVQASECLVMKALPAVYTFRRMCFCIDVICFGTDHHLQIWFILHVNEKCYALRER